ncbi:unnamed protein product [Vitrella brassicaformis CCMP3155]|uniref:Uncharacterized protein n=1 Tax=Vitrella brassicaformis (strain CCMP3155) TaxID=1169540 RepID=A0A0G4G4C2_VITBC|nr:unnamed protein product [Vitrella brassicaformis CCMP3155]|mmetsp:Transcript_7862/g.19331  ORF Transcript_7862/g.19331 Transcript_7862/m.19331 type:complete len:99 (-) Transcript_7862:1732-2028(-)|eukprot:CEM22769.1 unnamed protein product [Vitrella brassicaformis CCMP3155]
MELGVCCASCCQILSVAGVILLLIWGSLLRIESPVMEVPNEFKKPAATSCFIAAGFYVVTFLLSFFYLRRKAALSARAMERDPPAFQMRSMSQAAARQ